MLFFWSAVEADKNGPRDFFLVFNLNFGSVELCLVHVSALFYHPVDCTNVSFCCLLLMLFGVGSGGKLDVRCPQRVCGVCLQQQLGTLYLLFFCCVVNRSVYVLNV